MKWAHVGTLELLRPGQDPRYTGFERGTVICATAIEIKVSSSGSASSPGRRDSLLAYGAQRSKGKKNSCAFRRTERRSGALAREKRLLHVQPPCESAQRTIRAENAMARHEERWRIARTDGCRGPHRLRIAERRSEGGVGQRLPWSDPSERAPPRLLQRCAELTYRHRVDGCMIAVVVGAHGSRRIRLALTDLSGPRLLGEPGDDRIVVGRPP